MNDDTDYMRKYRVFPVLFSLFYAYLMLLTFEWYTALLTPHDGQSVFAGLIFTAGAAWFKFYVQSGNKQHE